MKEIFRTPALVAFEREGLLLLVSLLSPDNETYLALIDLQEKAVGRDGTVSVLSVIPRFDGPLRADRKTQEEGGARMRRFADKLRGNAMAVTVEGMKGTFVRMVLTTINLLNGTNSHIVGDIPAAVRWLQEQPGQRDSLRMDATLATAVQQAIDHALSGAASPA